MGRGMARARNCAAGAVAAAALILRLCGRAHAYEAAGDRLFPATLVLPQIGPGDEFYVNGSTLPLAGGEPGADSRANNFSATYNKTITDRLGVVFEENYTAIDRIGQRTSLAGRISIRRSNTWPSSINPMNFCSPRRRSRVWRHRSDAGRRSAVRARQRRRSFSAREWATRYRLLAAARRYRGRGLSDRRCGAAPRSGHPGVLSLNIRSPTCSRRWKAWICRSLSAD